MLARNANNFHQQFFRINGAGRVVWINNHNATRTRGNFGADIVKVREPVGRFITKIVYCVTAGERYRCCPQRIIGRRNQHFIAAVKQRLHRLNDQFGNTITNINIFHGHIAHSPGLVMLHNCFTGGIEPFRVAIALRCRQITNDIDQNFVRRFESEGAGLPIFSLRTLLPSSSRRFASFRTGPRMS